MLCEKATYLGFCSRAEVNASNYSVCASAHKRKISILIKNLYDKKEKQHVRG